MMRNLWAETYSSITSSTPPTWLINSSSEQRYLCLLSYFCLLYLSLIYMVMVKMKAHLTVEDVLRCVLLVLHVPDQSHSIRFIGSFIVVVIRGHKQLWVLRHSETGHCRDYTGRLTTMRHSLLLHPTWGDQSRQVTTLFLVQRSSANCLCRTNLAPACRSLELTTVITIKYGNGLKHSLLVDWLVSYLSLSSRSLPL